MFFNTVALVLRVPKRGMWEPCSLDPDTRFTGDLRTKRISKVNSYVGRSPVSRQRCENNALEVKLLPLILKYSESINLFITRVNLEKTQLNSRIPS